jgi:FkbM family methyltransferase
LALKQNFLIDEVIMSFRPKISYYLRVIARYIEDPAQLSLRRHFFMPYMYQALLKPWIQSFNIATVLDIGASVGDFAYSVRPVFPQAQIYSFEPLPNCYETMLKHLHNMPKFKAFNLGLGDKTGELTFYQSNHQPSSSFLPMTEAHKQAFPTTAHSQPVTVKIERLDSLAQQLKLIAPILVKIDVQGYEGQVLRGGEQTIKAAKAVIVETSFEPLYQNQPLFADVYQLFNQWGFTYMGALGQIYHPGDGRPLQEDSLFIKQ